MQQDPHIKCISKAGIAIEIDLCIEKEEHAEKGFSLLTEYISAFPPDIERVIVNSATSTALSLSLFQRYGFKKIDSHPSLLAMDIRKATRGIILNPLGEVLLIEMKADPVKRGFSRFWLTPGGKVETPETYEEALIREIREETGITDIEIGKVLFSNETFATWTEFPLRIFNRYYLVRSEKITPTNEHLMEDEKEIVLGYKWWSVQELESTEEAIFPKELASLITSCSF